MVGCFPLMVYSHPMGFVIFIKLQYRKMKFYQAKAQVGAGVQLSPPSPGGVSFRKKHLGSSVAARVYGPEHVFGTALTLLLRRIYLVWSIQKGSGLQLSILLVFFEQISIHRHNQALEYSQLWFKWSLLMKCKFNKTVTWSASAH